MGQYRPMFNIAFEHGYFRDGRLPGVRLRPTSTASRLMNNTNLVSRQRDDGMTIFFDTDWVDSLRLYAADQDDPLELRFECVVEQQNFQNFTSPDLMAVSKTLFFDSRKTDSSFIGKKYLHAGEYVSDSELVDPSADAGGIRGLAPAKPTMGVISIHVSPTELDDLVSGPPTVYNDYHIRFRNRETYWKYFLVGEANRDSAFIEDARGEIEFERLGAEVLANGRNAQVFLSRQPIPLLERSKPKFQLKIMKNNRSKTLVSRLQVASARRINRVVVNDRELFVSEIYVNF